MLLDYPPFYSELIIKTSFEKDLMQIFRSSFFKDTQLILTALTDKREFCIFYQFLTSLVCNYVMLAMAHTPAHLQANIDTVGNSFEDCYY